MQDLRAVLRNPTLLIWCLYLALTPFYVAPSGLPQPGDALIFLLVPATLLHWNGRLRRGLSISLRPLFWFVLWVCVVNYGWALVLWKFDNFKNYISFPIFYIFNGLVFVCALILYQRFGDLFLRLTVFTVIATIVFQVVASFVYVPDASFRVALFFNSPNQLGYYALLSACLIALTQRRLNLAVMKSSAVMAGCAYLALLSTSRASLIGIAILIFLLVFSNPRVIILASVAAIALVATGGPISKAIDDAQRRGLESRDSGFAEERGYDRLWKFKQHLLIGAGEGDYRRFDRRAEAREIHSSFATVLFSYGVIGAVLFALFVIRVVRGGALRLSIMLIPPLAYTAAHQGMRFTMLWILLAVYIALKFPASVAPTPRRQVGNLAPQETVPATS